MEDCCVAGLSDDHVHSCAGSMDAPASVLDLCQFAVELGLSGLCFTEHLDFRQELPSYGYYQYALVARAIDEARAQYGNILEIRLGLEVEYESSYESEIPAVLVELPVDFILGSVHTYRGKHFLDYRNEGVSVLPAEELAGLYRHYFSEYRRMLRAGLVDCLGHLDYPAKAGLRTKDGAPAPGYVDALEETLALAVAQGVGLEVNTRNASAGAPLAAPEYAVQRYVALGGRIITLGSDTHRLEHLADGLPLGRDVLRRAGLHYQTVFRQRKAENLPFYSEYV